jgi:P27 family predicted phage terminase small subunit
MNPGRRTLPANVHRLNNNPSKKSDSELREDINPDVVLPDPPEHLLPEAKTEWGRLGPEMIRLGLITQLDRAEFALYCQHWARWVHAEVKLKELQEAGLVEITPSGYRQIGVWLQISNRAAEGMHKSACEFGMTPSARTGFAGRLTPQMSLFPDANPKTDGAEIPANPAARHFD